jgi:hypothetical protein
MLKNLWRMFRSPTSNAGPATRVEPTTPVPDPITPVPTPPNPSVTTTPARAPVRDRDDAAWDRYEDRETAGVYEWSYSGTTVHFSDQSWQYHEPDTYRPKRLSDRFYNELSADHVDQLLSKWTEASQKGRVREKLEQAAHVTYMRRKHSAEARALAELLTRQCIDTYGDRCSAQVFEWRAKLLIEAGDVNKAIEALTRRLESRLDNRERERLEKALRAAERAAKRR